MTEPDEHSPAPPPKRNPAEFALRATPRRVTRLSRRTLVLASAGLTACLFGALWWALALHGLRLGTGRELYDTEVRPGSELLGGLPSGYADLTKPKPPPSVPKLGPPLPGGLRLPATAGPGGLASFAAPQPDAAVQERERLRAQAAMAGVLFQVSARPESAAVMPGRAALGDADTGRVAQHAGEPSDAGSAQNGQDRKQAFLNGRVNQAVTSPQRLRTPRSPYQLMAGTVIPAALVTGLDSDLPGQVIAQVTEDVYDSVSGRYLLVPQGARLMGKYDSVVAYGQSRVLLIWTRLVMPDGSSIVLDNLPAADTRGYAGLKDRVDYHTWRLLRGVVLSTLLGVSSELATNNVVPASGRGDVIVALRQSGDNSANQAGQRIVGRDLGVQPTLTVRPGFPVRVIVNRDILLRPYRDE